MYMSRTVSISALSIGFSLFTITAIPSMAIVISLRPLAFSVSLSPRLAVPMSYVPEAAFVSHVGLSEV